jgi:hypothetical protein
MRFAMIDSVTMRSYAMRCGKSRPVVFDTRRVGALELCARYRFSSAETSRMTDDQFKVLLRHLQVIVAILGVMAGVLLALALTYL